MLTKPLLAAGSNKRKSGPTNVAFLKGEIENIPLADSSVDVLARAKYTLRPESVVADQSL
jgi:ubiquinone/menaquinone biosynthesis C-methylase UbiE